MINKRLFTFGCSYTKWSWPTWADIIGTNYKNYYNLGHPGSGNYYISLKLYESNLKYIFTKNDVILIMLSSSNRFDFYNPKDKKFNFNGSVYNSIETFGEKFVMDVWNNEHSIYNTWFMVRTIKELLDRIGCEYKIVEAFGLNVTDGGILMKTDSILDPLIIDYNKWVYTKQSLNIFSSNYNPNTYIIDNVKDGHPTITCNHDFVKTHMNEFYTNDMFIYSQKEEFNRINLI